MITFIDPAKQLNEDVSQEENFARPDPNTPLQQFYSGANVFITGGSGFMGKVLIEKLLRCFPELGHVYLLMRQKKGKSIQERVDSIFENVLYLKLLRLSPSIRDKIRIVNGDTSLPGLGISPEDTDLLAREVNIVFHGAATVRFDERLKVAVAINVCGTVNLLELAKKMDKLKAFVHVSTAYANCPHMEIDEKFYDIPIAYDKLITIAQACPDDTLEAITQSLVGEYPNTYTMTKAAGEDAVRNLGQGLPIVVFRPSIVTGIRNDPLPGWCEGVTGPLGVMIGTGVGILKVLHGDKNSLLDVVPADMTVNAMITAAWDVGTRNRAASAVKIPVYNYTSCSEKPLTLGQFASLSVVECKKIPLSTAIWPCSFTLFTTYWVFWIYKSFTQNLFGWFIDTGLVLSGKEPKLGKIYQKLDKNLPYVYGFLLKTWKLPNNNVQALWLKLSDAQDKTDLMFDIKQVDWNQYFYNFVRGVRVFAMNDPLSTVPQAQKKQRRLRWISKAVKATVLLILLTIAWFILSTIFTLSGPTTTRQFQS